MTEVPYAVDAEMSLTYDELKVLELQYVKEQAQGHITTQTKFNYAWGLVKSPQREHQEKSIRIFQGEYNPAL
jgi:mitochondrial fission 1 protein